MKTKSAALPTSIRPQFSPRMRAVLPVAKQNTCSAGMPARLESIAIMRRMPRGWAPEPAGPSVPRITRCGHLSCTASCAAAMATFSLPLCTISMARAERSHSSHTCAIGSAVCPPLMWPMMSASASSTTSLSIRPEPGMEGPPVWMVLRIP